MSFLFKILYILTTFIETILGLRILLKIVNANTQHQFVSWILNTSDIFISPFKGILSNEICLDTYCIELTPIVALSFFLIVGFVFSEIAKSSTGTE